LVERGIPINILSFPSYPIATWGLQVKAWPLEQLYIMGVSMTAMSLSHETMPMGWISASAVKRAFSSSGKSATSATKGKLLPAILETSRSAAYYDSNAYQDLSNPTQTEI
jgi:hypothetical protein